jgi:predicted transcriptional regulator
MSIENLSNTPPSATVRQVKAARALLGWSQSELAKKSGVSEPTIARLEAGDGRLGGRPETVSKIIQSLTAAGIEFITEADGDLGVRLRSQPRR